MKYFKKKLKEWITLNTNFNASYNNDLNIDITV